MNSNRITLGFSPCPNDTFMFDAMVHNKIDNEGLQFEYLLADVEELNQKAFQKELDVTKLSFHAFAYAINDYYLLKSGSVLGENCGPLLISKENYLLNDLEKLTIAIPGKYTTANLLMMIANPNIVNKVEMVFSEIENAVLNDKVDAGLIIHENRFTYQQKGLKKIIDLGEYWENLTKTPIPLGCIAAKRILKTETLRKLNRILKRSILYALDNPESSSNFIKQNAQELDDDVIRQHINLYVNDYSLDVGVKGKRAINILLEKIQQIHEIC